MSDREQLNEMKQFMKIAEGNLYNKCSDDETKAQYDDLDEGANDNWGVGDFVVVVWDEAGRHGEPLKVTGVYGDQVRVVDDYGNSELMFPEDLRLAPNEVHEDENDARGKMCPVCTGG